jgi:glycine dehydrogenase
VTSWPRAAEDADKYGRNGATILAGEGQHLAIEPNFGGPGLGVFAVRYDAAHRNDVRQTPGRFVGKARDKQGRDARVMVMSTREQHIRKDKATSNICSNQAFLATLAGASMLARGAVGLGALVVTARANAGTAVTALTSIEGVRLAYPGARFYNEFTLESPGPWPGLEHCRKQGSTAASRYPTGMAGRRQS